MTHATHKLDFNTHRRELWALQPNISYLNHGSYGAALKSVLLAQQKYRDLMEAAPTVFMRQHLPQLLDRSRQALAKFVNAPPTHLGFVFSATDATSIVLRSLSLRAGDEILVTNHGYDAVRKLLHYLETTIGIKTVVAHVAYPFAGEQTISAALAKKISPQTKLVIVDHITSATALIFPIEEVVALCKQRNVPILVDGAHGPGQIPLNLQKLDADFYIGNFHKWMCSPKGCGFLYANERWHNKLHPQNISHHYQMGFVAEFDFPGTNDFTSWLCVPECIEEFESLGGFEKLVTRNRTMALEAAKMLVAECPVLSWGHDPDLQQSCMIAMPIKGLVPRRDAGKVFIDTFYETHGIDTQCVPFENQLIFRISVQAYNTFSEYQALSKHLNQFDFLSLT